MNTEQESPTFSLVFLTWNAENFIPRTFDSLVNQTYGDFEIVVVDNDSDDDTLKIVRGYEDELLIRTIENDSNLGFSRGTNKGIEASQSDYIGCFNHDTYFPRDYLETLSEYVTPEAVWTTARENHRVSKKHLTVRLMDWQRYAVPYIVDSLSGLAKVNFVPGDGVIIPRTIYQRELAGSVFELPYKGEDVDLGLRLIESNVPMYAILDTYSVHPDEGIYDPSVENLRDHLVHMWMRSLAYRRNGGSLGDQLAILASLFTIPLIVLFGEFPRPETAFRGSRANPQ